MSLAAWLKEMESEGRTKVSLRRNRQEEERKMTAYMAA
jgi:hypothetical protein